MTTSGYWFAWFPVIIADRGRKRLAWLEYVWRTRTVTPYGSGPYRYYA